jgi:hypothetical protein
MTTFRPSASLLALAFATLLVASPAAAGPLAALKSVGEILLDEEGRAVGQNLAGHVGGDAGVLRGFTLRSHGDVVFDRVDVDGLTGSERIEGVGTPTLSVSGTAAKLLLHDNVLSVLEIEARQPTSVTYHLGPGVSATQLGPHGAIVRLTKAGETIGHVVAVGAEGARTRGEVVHVRPDDITARLQSGSELLFVGRIPTFHGDALMETVVEPTTPRRRTARTAGPTAAPASSSSTRRTRSRPARCAATTCAFTEAATPSGSPDGPNCWVTRALKAVLGTDITQET